MAAFGTLTLADGQTTPVNHSFTPAGKQLLPDGVQRYSWLDLSVNNGLGMGANRFDFDVRMPNTGGRRAGDAMNQLALAGRFTLPTLEVSSGTTAAGFDPQATHAYDTTLWWKIVRNGRSGQQPVKDVVAFARAFFLTNVYLDAALNYGPPTG